jgi:hypothetical protein
VPQMLDGSRVNGRRFVRRVKFSRANGCSELSMEPVITSFTAYQWMSQASGYPEYPATNLRVCVVAEAVLVDLGASALKRPVAASSRNWFQGRQRDPSAL